MTFFFLAALGLCCFARAFSSCGVQSSPCGGFSCCGARALDAWASVVVAHRLYSARSVVVAHGLSCSTACGIRARTRVPCIGRRILNHRATREVPSMTSLKLLQSKRYSKVQIIVSGGEEVRSTPTPCAPEENTIHFF